MGEAVETSGTGPVELSPFPGDLFGVNRDVSTEMEDVLSWADDQAALTVYCRDHGLPFVPVVVDSIDPSTEAQDFVPPEKAVALASEDRGFAQAEAEVDIARVAGALEPDDFELLWLVYAEEMSQATIARLRGTNRMNVSRKVAAALRKGGEALGLIAS